MGIPTSVKRNIPREIAGDSEVIGRVRIEMDASRARDRRKNGGCDIKIRLFELEGFNFGGSEADPSVLRALIYGVFLVSCILPTEASKHIDTRPVTVL